MELLACYASSSSPSDDGDEGSSPKDASPRLSTRGAPRHGADPHEPSDVSASVATRSPAQETAARAALARRFAVRARAATPHTTPAERAFAFRPYPARQAGRTVDKETTNTRDLLPLFSTLRALATAQTASSEVAAEKTTSRVECVPSWQSRRRMEGHTGAVAGLQWNPRYPPLFLSASMDSTVRVWSLPREYYDDDPAERSADSSSQQCRRVLTHHARGVKSAKWSIDGRYVWTGGYDGQAMYVDVETAKVVQRYTHHANEHVTCVMPHPLDPEVVLVATDRGRVLQRDLRENVSTTRATSYGTKTTGEIHDLLFLPSEQGNGFQFVSSSALTARDTSHQTLLVWDLRSGALLADHLHNELCSFTSLELHPNRRHFAGQSTTSEIVLFSARAPFKKLKPKRSFHAGHAVQGFNVGFAINASGELLATGDVHGRVVLYDMPTRRVLKQHQVYATATPCVAVAFHAQWASTLLSAGADGRIDLLESHVSDILRL